jgi:hypothetical protein
MLLLIACVKVEPVAVAVGPVGSDTSEADTADTGADVPIDTADTGPDIADDTGDSGGGDTSTDSGDFGLCEPEVPLCDGAGCLLSFDLPLGHGGGTVTLDGADFLTEEWEVFLSATSADWTPDGPDYPGEPYRFERSNLSSWYSLNVVDGAWSGEMPTGTWDVSLVREGTYGMGERIPFGPIAFSDGATVDLHAARHRVDLSVFLGGAALGGTSGGVIWALTLEEATTGAIRVVTEDEGAEDGVTLYLPTGTWDASITMPTDATGVAQGEWDLGSFTIDGDAAIRLDSDAVTVGGTATWGGAPFGADVDVDDTENDDAIYLIDVVTGRTYVVWLDDEEAWTTRVPPGTYDVEVHGTVRTMVHLGVDITADDTVVDIDVPLHTLSVGATYGGLPFGADKVWDAFLVQPGPSDYWDDLSMRESEGRWVADVPEGIWDVFVSYHEQPDYRGTNVAPVRTGVIVAADGTLDVDLVEYTLSGTLTFPEWTFDYDWELEFLSVDERGVVYRSFDTDGDWSMRVPAGTYDVNLTWGDSDSEEGVTKVARGLVVTEDATLDLHVDAKWVDLWIGLDGEPAHDNYEGGWFVWQDLEAVNSQFDFFSRWHEPRMLLPHGAYSFQVKYRELYDARISHGMMLGTCLVVE